MENENYERTEPTAKSIIGTDCEISSCEYCSTYRQKIEKSNVSYIALLKKTMVERNICLLKKAGIIMISSLASLVNFSRITQFSKEQLCLENILISVLYFLFRADVIGFAVVLFGGQLHWHLAFLTKSKDLTVFIMTCLQAKSYGLRFYEWGTMGMHIGISFFAVDVMIIQKTNYVSVLMYTLGAVYLCYLCSVGFYIEDPVYLFFITIMSLQYIMTGDTKLCYLRENMSVAIMWVIVKATRRAVGYTGLAIRMI